MEPLVCARTVGAMERKIVASNYHPLHFSLKPSRVPSHVWVFKLADAGAMCKMIPLHTNIALKRRCCRGGKRRKTRCVGTGQDGSDTPDLLESASAEASNQLERDPLTFVFSPAAPEIGHPLWLYGAIIGLASTGFIETAYLTFTKLSGESILCPIGGASCNDVLNSEYANVFGVPLSMVGMVSYGSVVVLGLLGTTKTSLKVADVDLVHWLLLGDTGAMAAASAYFMYILVTKFEGASCTYCVASALLSLSLLLLSMLVRDPFSSASIGTWIGNLFLQKVSSRNAKQVASVQLAVTAAVVVALSVAYGGLDSASAGSADIDLPPVEPEVTTVSSPIKLSLAKHLQSLGAKMYGAFWCSHCYEQKQMFGREAVKHVEYVECYPEGYRGGVQIAKACSEANIQGFPTWVIKGKVYSGEQELSELARISGFDGFDDLSSLM